MRISRDVVAVLLLALGGMLAAAKVGEDVFAHESTGFDTAIQRWILAHQAPWLVRLFVVVTHAGSVAPMCAMALAGAAYLWYRGHRRIAAITLLAPAGAVAAFNLVKHVYARPRPVGLGGIVPSSYSFPSGHATASTAICLTLAYVFWREGFVRRPLAMAVAIGVPVLVGVSRVYLNVHWATDVLGGWSAGLLVALPSVLLYDRKRRPRATTPDTSPSERPVPE